MLVIGDDEQRLGPVRTLPQRVVGIGDQLLGMDEVGRRMLVVGDFRPEAADEVTRLDEGIGRQDAAPRILGEFTLVEAEVCRRQAPPDIREQRRVRQVVEIDRPVLVPLGHAAEQARHPVGEMGRIVVDPAARGAGVDEEPVGPGLAGCGGEPAVGDAERAGELAQDRQLRRGVAVHDRGRIGFGGVRSARLAHVVVDEAVHGRRPVPLPVRRHAGGAEELLLHVVEQFARIGVGTRRPRPAEARIGPDRHHHLAVGAVPGIGLAAGQPVEVRPPRIEPAEHGVEGAVLQHEHHDMLDGAVRRCIVAVLRHDGSLRFALRSGMDHAARQGSLLLSLRCTRHDHPMTTGASPHPKVRP
jgi:hypothetical protein